MGERSKPKKLQSRGKSTKPKKKKSKLISTNPNKLMNTDRLNNDINKMTSDLMNTGVHRNTSPILDDPTKAMNSGRYSPSNLKFKKSKLKRVHDSKRGTSNKKSTEVDLDEAQYAILNNPAFTTSYTGDQWLEVNFNRKHLVPALQKGDSQQPHPFGYITSTDGMKYCKHKTLLTILEMRAMGFPLVSIGEVLKLPTKELNILLNEYYQARSDEVSSMGVLHFAMMVLDGYQSDIQYFTQMMMDEGNDEAIRVSAAALRVGVRDKMVNQMKDIGMLPKRPAELLIHSSDSKAVTDADKIAQIHQARNHIPKDEIADWLKAQKEKNPVSERHESRQILHLKPKQANG